MVKFEWEADGLQVWTEPYDCVAFRVAGSTAHVERYKVEELVAMLHVYLEARSGVSVRE